VEAAAEDCVLARSLLGALPQPEASVDLDALQTQLEAILRACRDAWPFEVSEPGFVQHLAARLPEGGALAERLAAAHAADLYLAFACAKGSRGALARFDEQLLPEVRRAVARLDPSGALADEVDQRLRQKLFVSAGGKIAEYQGTGPLVHWLRAIAVREALKLKGAEQRHEPLDGALLERASNENVELELIRGRFGPDFRAAFEASFAGLSARERNLLRMHVVEGLTIDQIGAFYRTHRTTAFRWLEGARAMLARNIRRELSQRLKLPAAELESLMGLLRSQLDVSIRRVLSTTAG
jgi:RNA polymerase sigma-70 factor (ECF subfamily)